MRNKTYNHTVRFNKEKLKFFTDNNPGFEKPQQVVDELLNLYWYGHKGRNMLYVNQIHEPIPIVPGEFVKPDTFVNDFKPRPAVNLYDAYHTEIMNGASPKHTEATVFLMKAEIGLLPAQKQKLELIAKEHSKTFEF